jgi:hypothetical protein
MATETPQERADRLARTALGEARMRMMASNEAAEAKIYQQRLAAKKVNTTKPASAPEKSSGSVFTPEETKRQSDKYLQDQIANLKKQAAARQTPSVRTSGLEGREVGNMDHQGGHGLGGGSTGGNSSGVNIKYTK